MHHEIILQITLLSGVTEIEGNTFDNNNGKKAGTYALENGRWRMR